jgi:hypothetical protein
VDEERKLAYKKLRAAAHHLVCAAEPARGGGFIVKPNLVRALNRALEKADALEEQHKKNQDTK